MNNEIILTVRTKHFRSATKFEDNYGCPIYQALKERYPNKDIKVGGLGVTIDGDRSWAFQETPNYFDFFKLIYACKENPKLKIKPLIFVIKKGRRL